MILMQEFESYKPNVIITKRKWQLYEKWLKIVVENVKILNNVLVAEIIHILVFLEYSAMTQLKVHGAVHVREDM